jgi:F420-dependent oxidoreductase-like protein
MKLGYNLGYSGPQIQLPVQLVQDLERIGYDSVWTAEAYGSDAVTPLAYLAALTSRIKLGTAIMQIPARTPAMTAMTMATLDQLSGSRALCGIGLSGPQVVEGWHGQPYGKPTVRIREYIQILRAIWAREEPVAFQGEEYQLPYTGPGAMGLGKPLKSIMHTRDLPIYVAALGPVNVRQAAQYADGWLPVFFSPYRMDQFMPSLEEGFRRAGNGKSIADFDIVVGVGVTITDDVKAAFKQQKPNIALYVGGMGARDKNFYNQLVTGYGYGDAAKRIQDLFLSGRKQEAEEAVPDELCDELALVGPVERIKERFKVWEDSPVSTILVGSRQREALQLMADLAGASVPA